MVWAIKVLRLSTISFRIFQGFLRVSFLSLWVFLELRTIRFLFYLFCRRKVTIIKDRIKLFLIQALRGLIILVIILQIELSGHNLLKFLVALVIILKIRAAPFHGWFLRLINQISWAVIFIFLTLIKFIPLIIIRTLNLKSLELFAALSFILAAFRRLYLRDLKKLSIISSVFFLGILYVLLIHTNIWLELIIIYSFRFLALVLYFLKSNEELSSTKLHSSGRLITITAFILLVNIAGLPPFPGFFLKLVWLAQANISLIRFLIFTISSGSIIFIYLSFSLKTLGEINWTVITNLEVNFSRILFIVSAAALIICPLIIVAL